MDKIQEAVEYCEFVIVTDEGRKIVQPLLNLATRYLSASGELPKKKEILPMATNYKFGKATQHSLWSYNQAIDDCTLAHLKAKEKWDKLVDKNSDEIAEYIEACVDSKVSQNYVAKDKLPDIYELAKFMHEEYENSARLFGWESQEKCRVPFNELPEANMKTMLSVATVIKQRIEEKDGA